MAKTKYKVGLYARLSKEDGRQESLSIGHQLQQMRQYLEKRQDLEEAAVYIDDGISGIHTRRPAFQRLLSDAAQGRIDCVMVKDLSRLSRNYIEAGQYLEGWFVEHKIRFISLELPFYDSLQEPWGMQSVLVPLQNVINDDFCRQTSLKIRSALRSLEQQGQFIGAFAPYGYEKSKDDCHVLEVDERAAKVVRWIFRGYAVEQKSMAALARELNEQAIPSPSAYKRQTGLSFFSPVAAQAEGKWTAEAVRHILRHPVYTGNLAQGRSRRKSYKVRQQMRLPPEEWIWAENTHPPLVDQSLWDLAQGRKQNQNTKAGQKAHLLGGLVFCGTCGHPMTTKSAGGRRYFVCPGKRAGRCTGQTAAEDAMEQAILDFLGPVEVEKMPERLEQQREETLLDTLYLEFLTGKLGKEQYLRLKQRLEGQKRTPKDQPPQKEEPAPDQWQSRRQMVLEVVEKIMVKEEEIQVFLRLRDPKSV